MTPAVATCAVEHYRPRSLFMLFAALLLYRYLNALLCQSSLYPDEYVQSLEVAGRLVFGRGILTWEWLPPYRIRSFLHPGFFAVGYWVLQQLRLADTWLFMQLPRIQMSALAACADLYIMRWATLRYGRRVGQWALALALTSSHFINYSTRFFSNVFIMPMTYAGFYYWDLSNMDKDDYRARACAVALFALATASRPDTAIIIMSYLLFAPPPSMRAARRAALIALATAAMAVPALTVLDTFVSRTWLLHDPTLPPVFVPWAFLKFNLISSAVSYFGTHPAYFYFSDSLALLCGSFSILMVASVAYFFARDALNKRDLRSEWALVAALAMSSVSVHKETRFVAGVAGHIIVICAKGACVLAQSGSSKREKGLRMNANVTRYARRTVVFLAMASGVVSGIRSIYIESTAESRIGKWLQDEISASSAASSSTLSTSSSAYYLGTCYGLSGMAHVGTTVRIGETPCYPDFFEVTPQEHLRSSAAFELDPVAFIKQRTWHEVFPENHGVAPPRIMISADVYALFNSTDGSAGVHGREDGLLAGYQKCRTFPQDRFDTTVAVVGLCLRQPQRQPHHARGKESVVMRGEL